MSQPIPLKSPAAATAAASAVAAAASAALERARLGLPPNPEDHHVSSSPARPNFIRSVSTLPHGDLKSANFPMDAEGRTYHVNTKRGEIANRILTVGSLSRAEMLANLCFDDGRFFMYVSPRLFGTFTGRRNGVPISIIATGMGTPMIDFMIREVRAVVPGPIKIVRFGTCGAIRTELPLGTVMLASPGAVLVRRDPDAWLPDDEADGASSTTAAAASSSSEDEAAAAGARKPPYVISRPVNSDHDLTELVAKNLAERLGPHGVARGTNATADSFYSSQGRLDPHFDDRNAGLVDTLQQKHNISTLEMETFHLLDLARCSRGVIAATAAAIILAQRRSDEFLPSSRIVEIERAAGAAVLDALAATEIDPKQLLDTPDCVWNDPERMNAKIDRHA